MSKKHDTKPEIEEEEITIDEPIETEGEVIEEPKKKFDKKKLLIAGGVLGTAIIGAAGFLLGKHHSVNSIDWDPDDGDEDEENDDDDLSDSDDVSED